jgi:predicted permease
MLHDVRHAWRAIRGMPVVAAVVVASLGVGIGVNTAVFSWVQAIVLRPLPGVADSASLDWVEPRADTGSYPGLSWREYGDLRERLQSLSDLIAFRMVPFTVGEPGRVERAYALLVSPNYFTALGLRPAAGRFPRPDEFLRPGGEPVVVVSHDYWRAHLGGDPAAIGRAIRVNDQRLTIVGVTPPRFQGTVLGLSFDMWAPATLAPTLLAGSRELEDRALRGYSAIARPRPGVTLAAAQRELDEAMRELARTFPDSNANVTAEVLPFWRAPRGPQRMLANALLVLQGIMLMLLLAVCGNTANLMLARASARQREIGVRLALGASRARIATLLLAENLMLASGGVVLGAIIAAWGTTALRAVPIIGSFPIRFQTDLDLVSLAFAAGLGVLCGLVFGGGPALQLARVDPQTAIRTGVASSGRSGIRHALMAAEVGLALLVLLAAGAFVRGFSDARDTDPGFTREGVLLAAYDLGGRGLTTPQVSDFTRRLLERLRALPGVESAAIASAVPLDIHGLPSRSFTLEGRPRADGSADQALTNTVSPGYFRTMGIPLLRGADFADLGDSTRPPQAIVNEAFVRRFVGDGEALGRRITTRGTDYAIAAVVRNSFSESFGETPTPVVYLSYRDRPLSRGEMHVRTRAGAEPLLGPEIERLVRELDPQLPVYDVRTLSEHVERNLFLRRIPARMFVVLGPALLLLAAIGIYAVVAYSVSHRTTEIGVRMALGASAPRVVSQIVAESLRVVSAGALVGWTIAVVVDLHLVRDPMALSVFGGIPMLMLLVAALACWLPAHRAAAIDPVRALRNE